MNNLYFPICAVFINILILVVFNVKKRIKSDETKAYSFLITVGFLESLLACVLVILMNLYGKPSYIYNMHRVDYILMLLWVWGLFRYVLVVSIHNNKKLRGIIEKVTFIINLVIFASFFFLEVNVINENGVIDTNGPAMNLLFPSLGIYIVLMVVFVITTLIKNKKSSQNKKFIPLFVLAVLAVVSLWIRTIAPEILLISLAAAYADLIMFFTIENPDVKMIYELNKNKKLLESMSEEKSNFLFSMSQETRKPIENILEVKNLLEKEKNPERLDNGLKVIENNARSLNNIINNILDISNISSSKLAKSVDTYNPYSLLNMCIKNLEQKLNNKVELKTDISKNIPTELYGDSVALKQVITSILFNAAKYTKEGNITLTVNEIVKYDVCRLVINIEDSGKGMSVDELNKLLKSNSNIEDTDLLKLDNLDVDLKLAFKLMRKQGGVINVKSEDGVGTTFTIVIDQRIKQSEDKYYSKYLFNKKKVIVISDKLQTLKDINSLADKYDIELLTSMFGNDLVQRIKDGETFDLIILEDEAKPMSALSILEGMQDVRKNFNIPTVVMLRKEKESLAKHYLEDGFDNYIIKEDLEKDFDKVIKKYI